LKLEGGILGLLGELFSTFLGLQELDLLGGFLLVQLHLLSDLFRDCLAGFLIVAGEDVVGDVEVDAVGGEDFLDVFEGGGVGGSVHDRLLSHDKTS